VQTPIYGLYQRAGAQARMSEVTSSIVLTVANLGGLGLGPLIGGALAQFGPAPLVPPYLAFAALIVLALLAESTTPETAQAAFGRVARQPRLTIALIAILSGLGLLVLAVWVRALAPFLLGGTLLGAGNGLLFAASLDTSGRIAPRGRESEVLGTIFLAAYAGLAVPAIAVGVALELISPAATLTGFAVLMGVLGSIAVTTLVRGNKEASTP
jgi:hypothetical protein